MSKIGECVKIFNGKSCKSAVGGNLRDVLPNQKPVAALLLSGILFFIAVTDANALYNANCGSCDPGTVIGRLFPGAEGLSKREAAQRLVDMYSAVPPTDQLILGALEPAEACKSLGDACAQLKPAEVTAIITAVRANSAWWYGRYWDIATALAAALLGGLSGHFAGVRARSRD